MGHRPARPVRHTAFPCFLLLPVVGHGDDFPGLGIVESACAPLGGGETGDEERSHRLLFLQKSSSIADTLLEWLELSCF